MSLKAWINGIGVSLVLWGLLFWAIHAAVAADLALPPRAGVILPAHPHILRIKPTPSTTSRVPVIAPLPRMDVPTIEKFTAAPELCLEAGHEPFPGQTLQHDDTCPTKLRWVKQK